MIVWMSVVLTKTVFGDIDHVMFQPEWKSLDSNDDFHLGCLNVSKCHHKESLSRPLLTG